MEHVELVKAWEIQLSQDREGQNRQTTVKLSNHNSNINNNSNNNNDNHQQ
jgi:hypothetical protein